MEACATFASEEHGFWQSSLCLNILFLYLLPVISPNFYLSRVLSFFSPCCRKYKEDIVLAFLSNFSFLHIKNLYNALLTFLDSFW